MAENQQEDELSCAARLEDVEKVRELVKLGRAMEDGTPNTGYTPLHSAAMATKPNPEIVKLLLDAHDGRQHLNQQTAAKRGLKTALHIAAANVNVTQEFIEQFAEEADPLMRDSSDETAYHVAAKSANRKTIIYMLNAFAQTDKRWYEATVDSDPEVDKVINICAKNGNVRAVELLIQRGADISRGVLHEIVLESVRNPEKIDKLVRVYRTIVDNAVTWRCLVEKTDFVTVRLSEDYAETFRETAVWLLTHPVPEYDNKDVLQCALANGASDMFQQIINTNGVFLLDGRKTLEVIGTRNVGKQTWIEYDVTNFTKETVQKQDTPDIARDTTTPDFGKPSAPDEPYLTQLLKTDDRWFESGIFNVQPLEKLTEPRVTFMQRAYLLLGLLQLAFMSGFTSSYMPTSCFLASMFNISATHCGSSTANSSNSQMSSTASQERSWQAGFWLIWPIVLTLGNVDVTAHTATDAHNAYKLQKNNKVKWSFFVSKLQDVLLPLLPVRLFCLMMYGWMYLYASSDSYESYSDATAMVLLFGWIANVSFLSYKNFIVFVLIVQKIVTKEIPVFMLTFGFAVVGFALAMHAIRVSVCLTSESVHFNETSIFFIAFGTSIAGFFDFAATESKCAEAGTVYLFEFVYFGYVCVTLIILLNILIATMTNDYKEAKQKANNTWRFQMLSTFRIWESQNRIKTMLDLFKKFGMPDMNVKHPIDGPLYFHEKLNRYYLVKELPSSDVNLGGLKPKGLAWGQ